MGRALRDGVADGARMKPIGAFSPFGETPPWLSFGSLGDGESEERMAAALVLSQTRGYRWVAQIGMGADPTTPADTVTRAAMARFTAHGLTPYIVAVTYGEEWYELFTQDAFAAYGYPATHPGGLTLVRQWMGLQHQRVRALVGPSIKIIWLTTRVDAEHPVPAKTDWVALDPYPVDDDPFAATEASLLASEKATTLPLIVIPRWFRCVGPQRPATRFFGAAPATDHLEGYARILARPRWIGMWGWLWESRRHANVLGLADLPETRDAVARSLGVMA